MPDSVTEHREAAARRGPVALAVVTVSDTRTVESDENGQYLTQQIEGGGNVVRFYQIIPDEPDAVLETLDAAVEIGAQVILFNGGTGIAHRDTTFDALAGRLEKTLPGFGEIFRMLSYEQVGSAAMLSRATAGTYRGAVVISTPGSPKAVRLAWEKLIAPEMAHLAWEVGR